MSEKQTEAANAPALSYGEQRLAEAIDRWHENELAAGLPVPDFWDDTETGERLARYLWEIGYRKIWSP